MGVDQVEELRLLVQQLFRRFGALSAESTPCGQPLSIAHAHALMILLSRGELAQQDLGLELRIDKSNVARLCAKMEEAGHVRQRAREDDARSRLVSLTTKGKRLAAEVEASSKARFRALLDSLPSPRRASVVDALQLLVVALDVPYPPPKPEKRS